jgi:hypothetical protein
MVHSHIRNVNHSGEGRRIVQSDRFQGFDRPSRFAAFPGDMKIPPAYLHPRRRIPVLWHVVLATDAQTWRSEFYAASSTEATELAIDWLRRKLWLDGMTPRIRVLEVLQVGV